MHINEFSEELKKGNNALTIMGFRNDQKYTQVLLLLDK